MKKVKKISERGKRFLIFVAAIAAAVIIFFILKNPEEQLVWLISGGIGICLMATMLWGKNMEEKRIENKPTEEYHVG